VLLTVVFWWAPPALAHPHAWIEMKSDVVFDESGRVTALNIEWKFDADYSAMATDGLDANGDGFYSAGELQPLARENIEALKEYGYFVYAKADGRQVPYGEITDYGQVYNDGILEMHFVLPLAEPVDPRKAVFTYQMYDPTFYIAMDYKDERSVTSIGAMPAGCRVHLKPTPSDEQTEATRQMLAGKDQYWTPPDGEDFGSLFAQPVAVECARKAAAG
jgi:ABC-type uncharacterized transport system substrate-binding protein